MSLSTGCERVRARLIALVEGELAALDEARDRGHLEACAACARECEELARLRRGIRALARVPEHELARVHTAVLAHLRAREPARRPKPARPLKQAQRARFVLAAAAALVLALLWTRSGLPSAPHADDLPRLEHWLERLPAWPELLHGLEGLARPL